MSGIEFTPDNVVSMHEAVHAQNAELVDKLAIVGKSPSPLLMHTSQMQVLLDTIFDDDPQGRQQFDLAVALRINQSLRDAVEGLQQQLVVPGGTDA